MSKCLLKYKKANDYLKRTRHGNYITWKIIHRTTQSIFICKVSTCISINNEKETRKTGFNWCRIELGGGVFFSGVIRCVVHSFINCTGNRHWSGLDYKPMKHNLREIKDKRFSAYIHFYTNGYIWTKHYITLQCRPKQKQKNKTKQRKKPHKNKQNVKSEQNKHLVMSNINNTKIYETCEYVTVLSF